MKTEMELFSRNAVFSTASGDAVVLEDWLTEKVIGTDRIIFVGTDSQNTKRTNFTTALVAYEQGKGGIFVYKRYYKSKMTELHQRLSVETWNSIYLAMLVQDILKSADAVNKIVVHLDVSNQIRFERDPNAKSGKYMAELVGAVVAQGFECKVKPESFAATGLADHIVRER